MAAQFVAGIAFVTVVLTPAVLALAPVAGTVFEAWSECARYILWGLWFPLLLLSTMAAGRAWCGLLCPMGAASQWLSGRGMRLPVPHWLRGRAVPIVAFLLVTFLGQTLGVRDHAEAAAGMFAVTFGAAALTGWLFAEGKRAWCRHACPVGPLLGVFARLGAVEIAPREHLPGGDRYAARGICPTFIDVAHKAESRHCIECLRCVNPRARNGLTVRLRRPGREIERIRGHSPDAGEIWFLFLAIGAADGAFLWPVLPEIARLRQAAGEAALDAGALWLLSPGPAWLMSVHPERNEVLLWLDFLLVAFVMAASMLGLAAMLAGSTRLAAHLARAAGADGPFGRCFVELGYQHAPVGMVSLVLGLGAPLFEPLRHAAIDPGPLKALLFALGFAWSLWLADRILARQGVARRARASPLLAGSAGSAAVALAWWPALFGLPWS